MSHPLSVFAQRHHLSVIGNDNLHARVLSLLRQLCAREQTMIDRFHMDRDNLRLRRSPAHPHHVTFGHRNRIAMQKLRRAGITPTIICGLCCLIVSATWSYQIVSPVM